MSYYINKFDLYGKLTEREMMLGTKYDNTDPGTTDRKIIKARLHEIDYFKQIFLYEPASKVREDVHGKWQEYDAEGAGFHYCSVCKGQAFNYEECGETIEVLSNFCPNCGADMRITRPMTIWKNEDTCIRQSLIEAINNPAYEIDLIYDMAKKKVDELEKIKLMVIDFISEAYMGVSAETLIRSGRLKRASEISNPNGKEYKYTVDGKPAFKIVYYMNNQDITVKYEIEPN